MVVVIVGLRGAALTSLESAPSLVEPEREEFPAKSHSPQERHAEAVFLIEGVTREEGAEQGSEDEVGIV